MKKEKKVVKFPGRSGGLEDEGEKET